MIHKVFLLTSLALLLAAVALLIWSMILNSLAYSETEKYLDEHYPDWKRSYPGPS
jgi:hypothetical protein